MVLPPGEDDLEILEKLKEIIKNGQHEFYRAVPQPRALASLYLGPNAPAHGQGRPEPLQPTQDGLHSPVDQNRTRPPRIHNKDRSIAVNTSLVINNVHSKLVPCLPPSNMTIEKSIKRGFWTRADYNEH